MKNTVRVVVATLFALGSAACQGGSTSLVAPTAASGSSSNVIAAASSLFDASWRLVEINGEKALPNVSVTATFSGGSALSGSGGCNKYFGSATVTDGKLAVSPLGSTRMYCGEAGVADQEDAYFKALANVTGYSVVGAELRLSAETGKPTLVFVRE